MNKIFESFKRFILNGRIRLSKFITHRVIYPFYYSKNTKKSIDNDKVVFIETQDNVISDNYQPMINKLANTTAARINIHFIAETDGDIKLQRYRAIKVIEDIATAKYVFINDDIDFINILPIRKDTVVTQLWHQAGAYQRFDYGIDGSKLRDEEVDSYHSHQNYDYVFVSGDEVINPIIEAFNLEDSKSVVEALGVSATDKLFDQSFIDQSFTKLYTNMPSAKNKKVILYAPNYRGDDKNAVSPDYLDIARLMDEFADDYVLIFKHHDLVKTRPMINEIYSAFAYDMSMEMSIDELMVVSDICITDYSSIIFNYSLFERPIIFFAYDYEEYFNVDDYFFTYEELTPGVIVKTNIEIIEYIHSIQKEFDTSKVIDFKNKFMNGCDGQATKRILERVFADNLTRMALDEVEDIDYCQHYSIFPINSVKQDKLMNERSKYTKKLNKIYQRISSKKAKKDAVFVTYDVANSNSIYINLISELENNGIKVIKMEAIKPSMKIRPRTEYRNAKKIIKMLGKSKFILADDNILLLNEIDINTDTSLIYLNANNYEYVKSGQSLNLGRINSDEAIQYNHMYYRNKAMIPINNDLVAERYEVIYGTDSEFVKFGNMRSDSLYDDIERHQLYQGLIARYPEIEDKKILLMTYEDDNNVQKLNLVRLYEELNEDYITIFSKATTTTISAVQSNFYHNFYRLNDIYINDAGHVIEGLGFTYNELLHLAELVVTDYDMESLDVLAVVKPLLFNYVDQITTYQNLECFNNEENKDWGNIVNSTDDLIAIAKNIEDFNYDKQNKAKELYAQYDSEINSERFVEYLINKDIL